MVNHLQYLSGQGNSDHLCLLFPVILLTPLVTVIIFDMLIIMNHTSGS